MSAAAQGSIDGPNGTLRRAIGPQTLELRLDDWPDALGRFEPGFPGSQPLDDAWRARRRCGHAIALPYTPVTSVLSITYFDPSGQAQVLDPGQYRLVGDDDDSRVELAGGASWPAVLDGPEAIKVRYAAGYQTCPAPLVSAILLMVRNLASLGSRDPTLRTDTVVGVSSQSYEASNGTGLAINQAVEAMIASFRVLG